MCAIVGMASTEMDVLAHVSSGDTVPQYHSSTVYLADSEFRSNTLLVARGMAIFQRGTHKDIPGKQVRTV